MQPPSSLRYRFGDFCLDAVEHRFLRGGVDLPLAPKVFDTLLLLVENSGHMVEKDEFMRRVWPDTFVGDDALARNISILRKTLGESPDSQTFIATVPTRGYRFVAPVEKVCDSGSTLPGEPASKPQSFRDESAPEGPRPIDLVYRNGGTVRGGVDLSMGVIPERGTRTSHTWLRRTGIFAVVLGAGVVAGLTSFYLLSPRPVPRVIRSVQLTHSGRVDPWLSMVTDGSRIYYIERAGDHWNLAHTSVAGGDSQVVPAPFQNTIVRDISPDHANLLIGTFEHRFALMPLWIWPVQGGAPTRIGDITAYDAAWHPNGREILYARDDGIYLASTDGTNVRKFLSPEGHPGYFSWSPDGGLVRFSTARGGVRESMMWEVHSDGTGLRRLIPGWNSAPSECCGSWAANGKYYFFHSRHSGSRDIWAIEEKTSWLHRRLADPIRMTSGPTDYSAPLGSSDGRKVFVYGTNGQDDFVRYDLKSRQFAPVFPGLHATSLAFSHDGGWLAYTSSYQDLSLVRMRTNGTERLVVAPPSLEPVAPRWSPDGRLIVFEGLRPNRTLTIWTVSPDGRPSTEMIPGGSAQAQYDPEWSPDGRQLAFVREEKTSSDANGSVAIYLFDLAARQASLVPGSQGLRAPSWSPDGRFIAALSEDLHRVLLFDARTQEWTQFADGSLLAGPRWSKEGTCIYYQDLLAPNEPVYCFRLSNRRRETVVTFEQFLHGSVHRAGFLGLVPDGSLLIVLSRNDSDIYALDLELP